MMKKKVVLGIIALSVISLTTTAFTDTIQLPKTGQTTCWDADGNQISCTGTGQDGGIQAGVAWPNPRFTTNADTTITDNLTKLVWAPDGNVMQSRDPSFDTDDIAGDGRVTWYHALDYVTKLNNENYLGHTDWRLPNVNELESLINDDEPISATWLNNQGFTNVQFYFYVYWSSTTVASNPIYAWVVSMGSGDVFYDDKSYGDSYVWPVRAGQCGVDNSVICLPKTGQTTSYYAQDDGDLQKGVAWPNPRFTDQSNGTVTDNLTDLMWTKNANLPNGSMTWQQALDYVKTVNTGGHTDWRLPNNKELRSLADYSQYNPALPQGHPFTNVQTFYYWSSTTAGNPYYAWIVSMNSGFMGYYDKSNNYGYVWPVRAGGSSSPTVITLASFIAIPRAGKVILQWSTESETDNAGFNLYRSTSENGDYTKINDSLIVTKGSSTQGMSYEFADKAVKNGKTYYYKLEDIDLNGKSTLHGPINATPRLIYGISGK